MITSGQLGMTSGPDGVPTLVGPGTAAQLRQALDNAAALLSSQGVSLSDVRKATVYLVDMDDFAEMNAVVGRGLWRSSTGPHGRGDLRLPLGASVEVEVWAYRSTS